MSRSSAHRSGDDLRPHSASRTRALQVAESRYRAGATSYLQVVDGQRTLLVVQRLDVQIRGARAASTVALIRALGGGWDPAADVSGK